MIDIASYKVTMRFRVMHRTANTLLMSPFVDTHCVQPPVYVTDDPALLEMNLELKAKEKCLTVLRKRIKDGDPDVSILSNQDFIVRGDLVEFKSPPPF